MTLGADRPVIFWFRQDLRISDNPGLVAAVDTGRPVIPVYILGDAMASRWRPGGASRWWLHHSLASLGYELAALAGGAIERPTLILRRGGAETVLRSLIDETEAAAVFWTRCYEPEAMARDNHIKQALARDGIEARNFDGSLMFEPWTIATAQGSFYRVFTPYYRACMARSPPPPLPPPLRLQTTAAPPRSEQLEDLELLPIPDWAGGLRSAWKPGEAGARASLRVFLEEALATYKRNRDHPHRRGTSRLSPYLHFGEIGPRQIWQAVQLRSAEAASADGGAYLRQLIWREFSYHLLYHFPELPDRPLRPEFNRFPWRDDPHVLTAWQHGRTGYPIVDAGMRELWATGWMHNRVRMIVASFLVKDLLLPWQAGEAWFWDTLVDADLANNAASWQWMAGCGADAAPYFRILNPVSQGRRADPEGSYVRRWVPELTRLPAAYIHAPWEAPASVLQDAEIKRGHDYPLPVIDHGAARQRALTAFQTMRQQSQNG